MRRTLGTVLGVILAAVGILWILQGANALGQSGGMNGQHIWILIGALVLIIGLGVLYTAWRQATGAGR